MGNNNTAAELVQGGFDSLNATLNATSAAVPASQGLFEDASFFLLELQLVFGAMGIIYVSSHAALRRPPSAAPRKSKKPGQKHEDETQFTQGLEPSDAILFPLLAGALLIGLYYLIQWLKDPAILNTILRYYMSSVSIASLLTLFAHAVDLATNFVFPDFWRGSDGVLRKVDQKTRTVSICDDVGNAVQGAGATSNPLPGPFGFLGTFERVRKAGWEVRGLLTRHWILRFFVHGAVEEKAKIKFSHMLGVLMAVATALLYFSTSMTLLSNMLGYGMCYGSLQLLSPTDFMTGALVLSGLFFYDIVMVFYTPYMVTVATTLDVPIKLTFKAAGRQSILGLGDIVIPGILIAWTLRLDLYIHYLRKVKYEATDLKIVEKDAATGAVVERNEKKHREVKAQYADAKGNWGNLLWTRGSWFLSQRQQIPPSIAASRFSKVYFSAAMVGYLLGMLATLAMLLVFKRGQPALLYLVPGVLGAIIVTALARGEFKELWTYTEDDSMDTVDVVVEVDGDGKPVKKIGKLEDGVVDTTKEKKGAKEKSRGEKAADTTKDKGEADIEGKPQKGHRVFLLSLEAPPEGDDELE
ncbi:hypothetical protein S40288_05748 [Stachybotrys chartarum IBT 40288]|nr:hypothetical protein S40288_05748 [Stachybotrys chartarum IBT 40288]